MKPAVATITPHGQARIAGALYLVIMVCGMFAEGYVRGSLVVSGDAAATAQHILASERLYRLGGTVEFVTLFCDLAVALILYTLLRPVGPGLAMLALLFRVVFVAVFALLSLTHFTPLLLLQDGAALAAFSPSQLQQAALFSLRLHSLGFIIADVFFGIHCVLIGWLIASSTFLPRLIGLMLVIAGASYVIDSLAYFNAPEVRQQFFPLLLLPGLVAEGSLALWLAIRGLDSDKWKAVAAASRTQGG